MNKRHINVPIFIPHLGCPNDCVFCNQRKISGKNEFVFSNAKKELEDAFSTIDIKNCDVEIAFFGGSFTGIDRDLMMDLLSLAKDYVDKGDASSIRLSTRPDYISEEILDILSEYPVKTIEIGVQSIDDNVLAACKRGHTFCDTERAAKLINDYGFDLVGQMMIGLPQATLESEIKTAEYICDCGAVAARIYPTVVFRGTELENMAIRRDYTPLTVEDAIERSADVYEKFNVRNVPVIRVGLHASESLTSDIDVYAGANHPALGERIMSRVYFKRIVREIEQINSSLFGKNIIVYVAKGETSKVIGQKGENREKLIREFGIKSMKIVEKTDIIVYNIILEIL